MEPVMIGIDTNVLVRYMIQDDETQAVAASKIFATVSDANPVFINNIVMCELVWVLSRAYKYEKKLIVDVIDQLLCTSGFEFENAEVLRKSLRHYANNNADFSDYLIAEINKANKATITYTFDKKAGSHNLFSMIT
jgi:predicted nucleic-acid-binding protein